MPYYKVLSRDVLQSLPLLFESEILFLSTYSIVGIDVEPCNRSIFFSETAYRVFVSGDDPTNAHTLAAQLSSTRFSIYQGSSQKPKAPYFDESSRNYYLSLTVQELQRIVPIGSEYGMALESEETRGCCTM